MVCIYSESTLKQEKALKSYLFISVDSAFELVFARFTIRSIVIFPKEVLITIQILPD